jgi:hypothetical protein
MSLGKVKVLGATQAVSSLKKRNLSWLYYPIPISVAYVFIHHAYPQVSLFAPVVILGVCAGLLRNNLLQTLMAAMTGSVTAIVLTVFFDPDYLLYISSTVLKTTLSDPIVIVVVFAVFMIFFLIGGLFGLYFVNTLRRMVLRNKGKTRGKISKTS